MREKFNKALPHPNVLRSWYNSINTEPGFTDESFIALKTKVEEATKTKQRVVCSLMLDKIGIKRGTQ